MKKIIFILVTAIAVFTSSTVQEPYISFPDGNCFKISKNGGSGSFTIETDKPWTIYNSTTWLSLDRLEGDAGKTVVGFKAEVNIVDLPRDGAVIVRCGGASKYIVFTQSRSGRAFQNDGKYHTGWGIAMEKAMISEENRPVGALNNTRIDGFRPICFDLGQVTEYGPKYSGAFGTYTMKHRPLAIYRPEVDRTYFVYGGTTNEYDHHLLLMISCYDHKTGLVQKPTVVYDKGPVIDPHDNPSLLIDHEGYLWVFVAGRGNLRPGFIYRSCKPYDISSFEFIEGTETIMAYPQPYYVDGKGMFLFFTRYDGVRRTFYKTSPDGMNWTDYKPIASIIMAEEGEEKSGHYQITGQCGNKLVTAFNRHLNGVADSRTNIYVVQTEDFGEHWTLVDGTPVDLPVTDKNSPCRILEKESKGQNVYIKDVNFDKDGNPIILYLTSYGYRPGPMDGPREWFVMHWDGSRWNEHYITSSTNNYDSGSLYVNGKEWTVIAPFGDGPQKWGQGGEIQSYVSRNAGRTWKMKYEYTFNSPLNNSYVRRPENVKDPFYAFWADGNTETSEISRLYFGDSKGNVYQMPYRTTQEWSKPVRMEYFVMRKN